MNPSNDDCYFYYYSTCTKGNECPYRHCESALGTETTCTSWREGNCTRKNCKFRHMESRINRKAIQCYWENQPGGCRKPHCVFSHQRARKATNTSFEDKKSLIFPTPAQALAIGQDISSEDMAVSSTETIENSALNSTIPVEPVVVSLNDGEESDTESMTSTPVKVASMITGSVPGRNLFRCSDSDDFGIKTLEQLRMEKIHRESEHFYKCEFTEPSQEDASMEYEDMPAREIDLKDDSRTASPMVSAASPTDVAKSSDLRSVLKRKRGTTEEELAPQETEAGKRVIVLKHNKGNANGDSSSLTVTLNKESVALNKESKAKSNGSMNFQIKTLAEIRKEKSKEIKLTDEPFHTVKRMSVIIAPNDKFVSEEKTVPSVVRVRVKRPTQEVYRIKSAIINGKSPTKSTSDECTAPKKMKLQKIFFDSPEDTKETQAKENDCVSTNKSPPSRDHKGFNSNKTSGSNNRNERRTLGGFQSFLRRPLTQLKDEKYSHPQSTVPSKIENCPASNSDSNIPGADVTTTSKSPLQTLNPVRRSPLASPSQVVSSSELELSVCCGETIEVDNSMVEAEEKSSSVTSAKSALQRSISNETDRIGSIDEYDQLLMDDTDMPFDEEVNDGAEEKTDDIFLELEEMLKS